MRENAEQRKVRRAARAPRPTIEVTKEIIEQSKQRNSSHCMIAEAIKQTVPGARSVSVDLQSIRWTDRERGLRFTYLTPRVAQISLIQFDLGDSELAPFNFQLRNAQVTKSNTKKATKDRDSIPTKTTLLPDAHHHNSPGPPTRIGGVTPPLGPLSNSKRVKVGQRREYGLRALTR